MKTLWFKQCYVLPILSGEKKDTIRRESSKLPNVGDIIALTVGPRPPFVYAKIINRENIDFASLSPTRKNEIKRIYVGHLNTMVRLYFEICPV